MARRALLLLLLIIIGMAFVQSQKDDVIYYASLNHAIHEGQLDGVISATRLQELGDFGLGSEEKLKGELVLLDGVPYSIPSNGKAAKMKPMDKIAFATVKSFQADTSLNVSNVTDLTRLKAQLDNILVRNSFAALRITGTFRSMEFRSFVEQQKPYRPTDESKEVMYRYTDLEGTIVGFFTPASAEVLNSPPYHFHFIDKNRQTGGHVTACNIVAAKVEIDYAKELHIILPPQETTKHLDLNKPLRPKKD